MIFKGLHAGVVILGGINTVYSDSIDTKGCKVWYIPIASISIDQWINEGRRLVKWIVRVGDD